CPCPHALRNRMGIPFPWRARAGQSSRGQNSGANQETAKRVSQFASTENSSQGHSPAGQREESSRALPELDRWLPRSATSYGSSIRGGRVAIRAPPLYRSLETPERSSGQGAAAGVD